MNTWLAVLLSSLVGGSIVIQGGLNRQFAQSWGLPAIIFVNAITFLIYSILLVLWSRAQVDKNLDALFWPEHLGPWSIGLLIPGFCGFLIVLGVPWALKYTGALQVFVVIVAVQMGGSLLWDKWVDNIPLTPLRVTGALLAIVGVVVSSWPTQQRAAPKSLGQTNESPYNK